MAIAPEFIDRTLLLGIPWIFGYIRVTITIRVVLIARPHTALSIFGQFEPIAAFATGSAHQIANTIVRLSALGLA